MATSRQPKQAQRSRRSPSPAGTIPVLLPQHNISNKEPSFTCTICWQHQYRPDIETTPSSYGPKLLGSTARIVCRPCWCAVLNLSICWVCGECIVRGDEVVSLGWCFWHYTCFGCLICGTKISVPQRDDECFDESGKRKSHNKREVEADKEWAGKCGGVELAEIPLCDVCQVETAGNSQGEVLQKGLKNVSSFDGGLSRHRLGMSSEGAGHTQEDPLRTDSDSSHGDGELKRTPRRLSRAPRKLRGATGIKAELERFINDPSTGSCRQASSLFGSAEERKYLVAHAADMGTSEDSSSERRHRHNDAGWADYSQSPLEERPEIYISVLDPLGEAPFKQSSTKPHPKWMSLLPTNIEKLREQSLNPNQDILPSSHQQTNKAANSSFGDSAGGLGPIFGSSASKDSKVPTGSPSSPMNDGPNARSKRTRSNSSDGDEDKIYQKYERTSRKSLTFDSLSSIPREFSGKDTIGHRPVPLFPSTRPELGDRKSSFYFSNGQSTNTQAGSVAVRGRSGGVDLRQDIRFPPRSNTVEISTPIPLPPKTYSSEYLEIYNPVTSSAHHEKYVSKQPEPIIERIKRQKVGNKNMAQIAEDTMQKRNCIDRSSGVRHATTELDIKREDLKDELKSLFYGEIEQ